MITIVESDMTFGPYDDAHCFYVERSATYSAVQNRVPMAEFIFLQVREGNPSRVWIVEAKSSSPRSENADRFSEFISEIRHKLTNGLMLGVAARLRRHAAAEEELSQSFRDLDLAATEFRLVLVIKNHRRDWLQPLQERLQKDLHPVAKTWGRLAIVVLNEEGARRHGLVR